MPTIFDFLALFLFLKKNCLVSIKNLFISRRSHYNVRGFLNGEKFERRVRKIQGARICREVFRARQTKTPRAKERWDVALKLHHTAVLPGSQRADKGLQAVVEDFRFLEVIVSSIFNPQRLCAWALGMQELAVREVDNVVLVVCRK